MNRNSYKTALRVVALVVFGTMYAAAQTGQKHEFGDKKTSVLASKKAQGRANQDMHAMYGSAVMNEPHHVLAAAYKENAATFARALRDQAQRGALSSDFARAAAAEIERSLDQANEHYREHVKTMSADMRAKMTAMIKEMDVRNTRLKELVRVLEKDVGEYTLNSKQIAIDSDEILRGLDDQPKPPQPE